jgi:hypothetical protein
MKTCALRLAATAETEVCPEAGCAFWDNSCFIDRLSSDVRRPDVASLLLATRERLELARDLEEAEEAHREFSRRLGRDA